MLVKILNNSETKIGIIRPVLISLIVMLLFFQYNVTTVPYLAYLGVGILFTSALFLNPLEAFIIAVALNSSVRMIRFIDNPMAIQGYFMFLLQIKYFLTNKCRYPFLIVLNLLLAILTSMLSSDSSLVPWVLRGVTFLLFAYNVFDCKCPKYYIDHIINAYIIGTVVSQVLTVYLTITSGVSLYEGSLTAMNNDRNFNGAIVAVTFAITMFYLLDKKNKKIYIAAAFILVFTGLLSGSRTFLLSIVIVFFFFFYVIADRDYGKSKPFIFKTFLIGGIIVLVLMPVIMSTFDNILFSRFADEDMASGNGRFDYWNFYLKYTFDDFFRSLFGCGSAQKLIARGLIENVEHSVYVQSVFTFGIIGFLVLFSTYFKLYKTISNKNLAVKSWYLCPLIVTLFFYGSISALYSAQFDTGILLSFLMVKYVQNKNYKINEKLSQNLSCNNNLQ